MYTIKSTVSKNTSEAGFSHELFVLSSHRFTARSARNATPNGIFQKLSWIVCLTKVNYTSQIIAELRRQLFRRVATVSLEILINCKLEPLDKNVPCNTLVVIREMIKISTNFFVRQVTNKSLATLFVLGGNFCF